MKNFITVLVLITLLLSACSDNSDNSSSNKDLSSSSTSSDPGNVSSISMVSLTTEIPPELIEGTPQPIKVPNLVPEPKTAPTLMVPQNTVLLSAGKTVSSSDDFPIIGELDYVTDGDKEASEGYFVELMDGLQWIQIDLNAPSKLSAIWIWHYHSQKRAYHDVIVQVSNDPAFESEIVSLFNNDYDNSAGQGVGINNPYVESRFGKLVDAKGITARYVRLWSNGNTANDMNHYVEVEVFGQP